MLLVFVTRKHVWLLVLGLKIRENITYIVAAVVIQNGKVLLIQEAKKSVRGKWYLPAGRMEQQETIVVYHLFRMDFYSTLITGSLVSHSLASQTKFLRLPSELPLSQC